jgi:hypothetical protein
MSGLEADVSDLFLQRERQVLARLCRPVCPQQCPQVEVKLSRCRVAGKAESDPLGRRWSNSFVLRDLFDHLVGSGEQRFGNGEAKCLGGLHVDDQLKLCRLQHRQVGGLVALEDAPDIDTGLPMRLSTGV